MRTLRIGMVATITTALLVIPGRADASGGGWRLSADQIPIGLGRMILLKLDDHRVIAIGGGSHTAGPADTRRVFVYDVDDQSFAEVASLPAAKNSTDAPGNADTMTSLMAAGVLADGSVVVAGGQISDDPAVNAQNVLSYRYYPRSNRWVRTGDLPEPQDLSFMPANLLADGRLLVVGGRPPSANRRGGWDSKKAFVYDPDAIATVHRIDPNTGTALGGDEQVTGRWDYTRTADGAESDMSQPHYYGNAVVLDDGRVFVAGGHIRWGVTSVMSTHTEFFDPATGMWTRGPNLPSVPGEDDQHDNAHGGRGNGVCMKTVAGGAVVIAGGAASSDDTDFFATEFTRQSILTVTPAADPAQSVVRIERARIPSAPHNGRFFGDSGRGSVPCWPTADGRIMIAGGQDSAFEDLYDAYLYEPTTGQIERGPDLPHGVPHWAGSGGFPADYQCARMTDLAVSMRASRLVFHHSSTFVNFGGWSSIANRQVALRRAEQFTA